MLWVLTPLAVIVAVLLLSQGVIDNFSHYIGFSGITHLHQQIAMGPVAGQEAIKELGTNGGGFFNTNSAHPFENPTGFSNLVEMLAVLVIPAALVFMYGRMSGNRRQGYAIYATMMVMFLGAVCVAYIAEAHGSPAQHAAGLHTGVIHGSSGGNLEGKEQRFGIAGSALFDTITTVTSCGAVNSAIESFTGIGGAVPIANLSASEVIFGGVGTGLYSILLYVLLAVFIGGLMVGRTPEYLGKKIEAKEIKLVAIGLLITPLAALFSTALATATKAGRASIDTAVTGHGPAGLLGDVLRVPQPGEQQRLGVRRLHGLRAAERRQPGRSRDQVRGHPRRLHDAVRAVRADPVRARRRRLARRQARQPRRTRHDADRQPDVRRAADRRDRPRWRADVLPRPAARTARAGPYPPSLLMSVRKDIRSAALAIVVFTLLCGLVFPLALEGIGQVAFPGNANGQKVYVGGKLVGSALIGQDFGGKPQYFQTRPSGTTPADNDAATAFANYGPNSTITKKAIAANIAAYIKLNGAYYPGGLTAAEVPVDAADTSASGVDPDISVANADIQAYRIAAVRHLPRATVIRLVAKYTGNPGLGFSGEQTVNVLELNVALDRVSR